MKIPPVKTWVVTDVDGLKFEVLAPTRRLAISTFYAQWGYRIAIETVGMKRK